MNKQFKLEHLKGKYAIIVILISVFGGGIMTYFLTAKNDNNKDSQEVKIHTNQNSPVSGNIQTQNNYYGTSHDSTPKTQHQINKNVTSLETPDKQNFSNPDTAPKKKELIAKNKNTEIKQSKPQVQLNHSPNSIIQVNENGSNIISLDIPEPKFKIKILEDRTFKDDHYVTKAILSIDSKVPVQNLYLQANAKTIISFEVNPNKTGMLILGHSGQREGFAFTNIPNALGEYILLIRTKESEQIEVTYDY